MTQGNLPTIDLGSDSPLGLTDRSERRPNIIIVIIIPAVRLCIPQIMYINQGMHR